MGEENGRVTRIGNAVNLQDVAIRGGYNVLFIWVVVKVQDFQLERE